jgi:hypothetical protein
MLFRLDFIRRQTSNPSIPGITISSETASGGFFAIAARHSAPLYAVETSKYLASSFDFNNWTLERISLITRTCPVIVSQYLQKIIEYKSFVQALRYET